MIVVHHLNGLNHGQLFCYFGPVEVYHSRITWQSKAHLMTRGEREVGRENWGGTEGERERREGGDYETIVNFKGIFPGIEPLLHASLGNT